MHMLICGELSGHAACVIEALCMHGARYSEAAIKPSLSTPSAQAEGLDKSSTARVCRLSRLQPVATSLSILHEQNLQGCTRNALSKAFQLCSSPVSGQSLSSLSANTTEWMAPILAHASCRHGCRLSTCKESHPQYWTRVDGGPVKPLAMWRPRKPFTANKPRIAPVHSGVTEALRRVPQSISVH